MIAWLDCNILYTFYYKIDANLFWIVIAKELLQASFNLCEFIWRFYLI